MSEDSAFLSPVGRSERHALPWLVWIVLSVFFSLAAGLAFVGLIAVVDPTGAELARIDGPLPDGPGRLLDEVRFTALVGILLLAVAISVALAARIAFERPVWTFLTPARRFRFRLLLGGFLLFGAIALASLLGAALVTGEPLTPPVTAAGYPFDHRVVYVAGSALFLLVAAAAEEIVFRGVLLQVTAAFTRSAAVLLLVNGVVFSAFHLDPSPDAFVARAVSGALWAWTVLRLAGLEFALGAHLANNLLLCLLVEPISEGAQTGRDLPLHVLALDLGLSAVMVAALLALLRSPRLRAWAGVDARWPAPRGA